MASNPDRVKALARSFAAEWLRPSDPEHATPVLVDKLETVMLAFFATAHRFGPVGASGEPELITRATEWLSNGGFFNPDVMARCHPDQTRDLILDLRNALAAASVRPVEPIWFCQQCPETFTDTRIAAEHSRHTYHVITSQPPNTPRGSTHARSEDA